MGHVSYVEKDQAAESIRPIYENVERKLGVMLNFFKVMAHNPEILTGFMALNGAMNKTKLDARLRELAYLQASAANGCDYCTHYHQLSGKRSGLNDRQVAELARFETSDAYDDRQRVVLRFADQVTRQVRVSDDTMRRLKEQFSDQEITELAMTVALANLTNRLNVSLQIDLP